MWVKQKGFTIVELLIVIVVIAVLASITVVAFNGIQSRARDSQRLNDITAITKALSLYKTDNGNFPPSNPNPGVNTFEYSIDNGFLSSLNSYTGNKVFKDPKNNSFSASYQYHTFNAGEQGCPAAMGPFYVLWATGMESQSQYKVTTNGCNGQTLYSATPTPGAFTLQKGDYVIYGFN